MKRPNISKLRAIREAGNVLRYHQVPTVGQDSVAQHSWGVAMLICQLKMSPSKELIMSALSHDLGERWAGDIPAPVKWRIDMTEIEDLEKDVRTALGFGQYLGDQDTWWLKCCDMLECFLYSHEQIAMGNKNFTGVLINARKWLQENNVPEEVEAVVNDYNWQRESETEIPV